MILYCHCVKDSKPNNSLCMKHSRGKYCNDRVLLNMIEEAITFCISLPGCFFFFFLSSAFFSSFSDGRKFDHIKPCLSSFSIPWGASAAESPRDNKGKNIKAHKQDTHTHSKEKGEKMCALADVRMCVCACFKTHTGLCKWLWACMCARLHKELEFRAFTRCSCVCLVGSW